MKLIAPTKTLFLLLIALFATIFTQESTVAKSNMSDQFGATNALEATLGVTRGILATITHHAHKKNHSSAHTLECSLLALRIAHETLAINNHLYRDTQYSLGIRAFWGVINALELLNKLFKKNSDTLVLHNDAELDPNQREYWQKLSDRLLYCILPALESTICLYQGLALTHNASHHRLAQSLNSLVQALSYIAKGNHSPAVIGLSLATLADLGYALKSLELNEANENIIPIEPQRKTNEAQRDNTQVREAEEDLTNQVRTEAEVEAEVEVEKINELPGKPQEDQHTDKPQEIEAPDTLTKEPASPSLMHEPIATTPDTAITTHVIESSHEAPQSTEIIIVPEPQLCTISQQNDPKIDQPIISEAQKEREKRDQIARQEHEENLKRLAEFKARNERHREEEKRKKEAFDKKMAELDQEYHNEISKIRNQ